MCRRFIVRQEEMNMKSSARAFLGVLSLCFITSASVSGDQQAVRTAFSPKEIQLRSSMKDLFNQCLKKQRNVEVQALTGSENAAKANDDLDKAVEKLGQVFGAYYSEQSAADITAAFKEYFAAAAAYARGVKGGAGRADALSPMLSAAGRLSGLFKSYRPFWSKMKLDDALAKYAEASADEIDMLSKTQSSPDANIFAATFDQNARLSEIFAIGVARQFPGEFKR
jgi:hypothetical protein